MTITAAQLPETSVYAILDRYNDYYNNGLLGAATPGPATTINQMGKYRITKSHIGYTIDVLSVNKWVTMYTFGNNRALACSTFDRLTNSAPPTPALPDSGYYCGTLQVVYPDGYTLTLGSCLCRAGALALLSNWYLTKFTPYNHSRADFIEYLPFYNGQPLDYSNESWLAWWKEQPAGSRSERGSARVDYASLMFLFFVLVILAFVVIDFSPLASQVGNAEIPVANFDKFNSLFHLW
jgi:hypothetical protein